MPSMRKRGEDEDGDADRHAAALAGRARLAERGKADQAGGESVERAGQPVEQFGAQSPGHALGRFVLGVGLQQLGGRCARAAVWSFRSLGVNCDRSIA